MQAAPPWNGSRTTVRYATLLSNRARISRISHAAIRGPSRFVGFGYRPSAIPLYHVDFDTGIISKISFKRIYPTSGKVRGRSCCPSPLEADSAIPNRPFTCLDISSRLIIGISTVANCSAIAKMFSGEIADSRFKSTLRCEDGAWPSLPPDRRSWRHRQLHRVPSGGSSTATARSISRGAG